MRKMSLLTQEDRRKIYKKAVKRNYRPYRRVEIHLFDKVKRYMKYQDEVYKDEVEMADRLEILFSFLHSFKEETATNVLEILRDHEYHEYKDVIYKLTDYKSKQCVSALVHFFCINYLIEKTFILTLDPETHKYSNKKVLRLPPLNVIKYMLKRLFHLHIEEVFDLIENGVPENADE